jgi:hypothetical protein
MQQIKLGTKAKDKVTGFEGIIIGKIIYLFGCNQYGLSPEARDGKVLDSMWFDEGRIEIIGAGIAQEDVTVEQPGGINPDSPKGIY